MEEIGKSFHPTNISEGDRSDGLVILIKSFCTRSHDLRRVAFQASIRSERAVHPRVLSKSAEVEVKVHMWEVVESFFKNDEGHNVTVNGDRYRAMITNFFIPELNNHDVEELWFQQDGATCHTARATIDLLKDAFDDRLISRFGPVNWPLRSCDLTPLDFFFVRLCKVIGLCGQATNA
ncbi:uncharacterized protein TNCV_74181 [Trichonephila clavipes]|nr:uncharacterized protein TNCV_74181 [Trichonephila clavipes]